MKILRAKVTSKGQITLPKPLRESLDIHEGDQVEFAVDAPRKVSMRKLGTPGSSAGILRHLAKEKPVSVEEMNEAIGQHMVRKFGGSSSTN